MLKLKIRVPYKDGRPCDILQRILPFMTNAFGGKLANAYVLDGCLMIEIDAGRPGEYTMDLRYLSVENS